ncbi:MAG: CapA family protein, partial [Bacteroidales bacterium]|nr:CapA family protein [Bacteroidales bacterium]
MLPAVAAAQVQDTVPIPGHRHDSVHFAGHRHDSLHFAGHRHDSVIAALQVPDSILIALQERDTVLTLLFAGDIMGHDGQIAAALDDSTGKYEYDSVFKYISPVISAADVAIGNLEVTLGGAPYKGYPAFSSPDA